MPTRAPSLPQPVADAAASAWAALARRRHARALHPMGEAFEAVLELPGGTQTGAPFLDDRAVHRGVVRLSRAVGLPSPLPDARGLALRIPDLYGAGRHQDLLLTTSVDVPVLHHLPLPAAGPRSQTYSSLLPYRVAGETCLLGAQPVRGDDRAFTLAIARHRGRFRPLGLLRLGAQIPHTASEQLHFNPWNTGGGIEPAPGLIQRLRRPAYAGSQAGRDEVASG